MKNNIKGHIALFAAYTIFGLNLPVARSLVPDIVNPYVMTLFCIVGATVLFWIASLFVKKETVPLKDIGKLAIASLFCITLNNFAFVVGLSRTTPVDASIVVTMLPVFCMILAALVLKEPITFKKAIGVLIGASGALLLILGQQATTDIGAKNNILGNLIIFISVASFAVYLTFFKDLISRYSPITLMKWMFLFSSICSLPFFTNEIMATNFHLFDAGVYWRMTFSIVCASFVSFMLIPVGQKVLRPTTISMYNYIQPIVASLIAVVVGMDVFGWKKALAMVLVFSGVYIVTMSKSKVQIDAEKKEKV